MAVVHQTWVYQEICAKSSFAELTQPKVLMHKYVPVVQPDFVGPGFAIEDRWLAGQPMDA